MHVLNDEHFHADLRKFLKTFGVTAQRELEQAVRQALAAGTVPAPPLRAGARLEVEGVALDGGGGHSGGLRAHAPTRGAPACPIHPRCHAALAGRGM